MTEKVRPIVEDSRPIMMVVPAGGDGTEYWHVGHAGVTKIVAYREHGQDGYIPWLAVYVDGLFTTRINCAAVESIGYINTTIAEPKEESTTFDLLAKLWFVLDHVVVDASNGVTSPTGEDEGCVKFDHFLLEIRQHLVERGDEYAASQVPERLPF